MARLDTSTTKSPTRDIWATINDRWVSFHRQIYFSAILNTVGGLTKKLMPKAKRIKLDACHTELPRAIYSANDLHRLDKSLLLNARFSRNL